MRDAIRPPEPTDDDLQVLAAAFLSTQKRQAKAESTNSKDAAKDEGWTQEEIAAHLGLKQPKVSRLLQRAQEEGWLRTRPQLGPVPEGWLQRMQQRYFALQGLKEHIERWGEGIRCEPIVCSGKPADFYRQAASHVASLLTGCKLVGVTWGRTLADVIECMKINFDAEKAEPIPFRCIPICGEPHYLEHRDKDERYHSTELARQLQFQMTGQKPSDMPVLYGVPAYIASRFSKELAPIRKYIASVPGYAEVFGPVGSQEGGLIDSVDAILTGVGLIHDDKNIIGTFVRERILQEQDKFERDDLDRWLLGDIAGILMQRNGLDPRSAKHVKGMNERWVGTRRSHLEECVKRSLDSSAPGVVLLALGPSAKAELIKEVVVQRLANRLIVHEDLAKALLELK